MSNSVNILAVAPYEGLATVLEREARLFADVNMTVVVGNLEQGVSAAIDSLVEPFDLILSRGGTADLLREELDLPVLDIKTSAFDVLQAVQLSEEIHGKRAVVGFAGITDAARTTNDVLQLGLDIFTLVDERDVHDITRVLKDRGFSTILCDVISSTVFRENGFNTVLITSGSESVRDSIDEAIRTARHVDAARAENAFLREVIRCHDGDTVIFNENGSLFLTTLDRGSHEQLLSVLRDLLPEVLVGDADVIRRSIGGRQYTIRTMVSFEAGSRKVAFYLRGGRPTGSHQAGITYYSKADARLTFLDNPVSLTNDLNERGKAIRDIVSSGKPLLITGEYGTGRTAMALYAYVNSQWASRPFAEIDCAMLNDRSREHLLNGRSSPLFSEGMVIHLKSLEACGESFAHELLSTISESNVCRRNYVIFSCDPLAEGSAVPLPYIKDRFQSMQIQLLPLRETKERIPTITRLCLSQLNANLPMEVLRVERQAMELLSDYSWPGNYIQFKRVLSQLCASSRDHAIRATDVREVLAIERPAYQQAGQRSTGTQLDLDRTLQEIERDIIEQAISRNGGNQSAAARQLGISRTTLWRLAKSS